MKEILKVIGLVVFNVLRAPMAFAYMALMSLFCFFCVPAAFIDLCSRKRTGLLGAWYKAYEKLCDGVMRLTGIYSLIH